MGRRVGVKVWDDMKKSGETIFVRHLARILWGLPGLATCCLFETKTSKVLPGVNTPPIKPVCPWKFELFLSEFESYQLSHRYISIFVVLVNSVFSHLTIM